MTVEYLKHAIIELTTECNLHCKHCYNWWKQAGEPTQHQNSYKKAFRLLEHLIRSTNVENFTFTGGEPTISERFIELVLHAKVNGKKVTIITNGNGKADIYKQLIRLQVNMMEFSILSSQPDVHDEITRKPGSWKRAVENMKMMISNGIPVTPVVVITCLNHEYAEETVRFFYDLGIRSVMVNRYNLGGEGLNHPNKLSATLTQLKQTFTALNRFAEQSGMKIFSGVCTPHCILNPDDYPLIRFGACPDNFYQRPLTFDIEGNLRLCNHSPVIAGNIYNQTLGEIITSDYVDQWSNRSMPFCQPCSRLQRCHGGCRAASEQMGLTLRYEDPIVHELKASLFL